jgi:hypothetical protein
MHRHKVLVGNDTDNSFPYLDTTGHFLGQYSSSCSQLYTNSECKITMNGYDYVLEITPPAET